MVNINLESADNGIIKTITDNNINGAGAKLESKKVYDFTDDIYHKKKIIFLYNIAEDLGLEIGNKYQANNLKMSIDWGVSYNPSVNEIKQKIAILSTDLDKLKLQLKQDNK